MSFELLPHLTPWIVGYVVLVAITLALLLGVVVESVVRHRRDRVARHQTVRAYYGPRLALHH